MSVWLLLVALALAWCWRDVYELVRLFRLRRELECAQLRSALLELEDAA